MKILKTFSSVLKSRLLSEPKITNSKYFFESQTLRRGFLPSWSQTNKSVHSGKQIRPMCGCQCYYLWRLSLNRLLARWARNGQSGLDCINYSSSPLYMALPCHTIQTAKPTIPYHTHLHTSPHCHAIPIKDNAIPNHAISYQHHTISHQPFLTPPMGTTIPLPLYPPTSLSLGSHLSFADKSNAYLFCQDWSGLHFQDTCRIMFLQVHTNFPEMRHFKPRYSIIFKLFIHAFRAQPGRKDVSV